MIQTEHPQSFRNILTDIFDDESIDAFQKFMATTKDLMSCYRCAIMEIETKFRVLDERFSLAHEQVKISGEHPGQIAAQKSALHSRIDREKYF